jgi:acetyltransferase-like isoleucine patch superfamily enzyme
MLGVMKVDGLSEKQKMLGGELYNAMRTQKRLAGLESTKTGTVGRNVWIGGGAILLPGITVGGDAVIGASGVVTGDVAPGVTVAGNPGRLLHRG